MNTEKDTGSTVALAPAAGGTQPINVLTFTLDRPQTGTWTLEAELDSGEAPSPPSGAQLFTFAAPSGATIVYAGTVIEARQHVGRTTVYAVGGAGGLRNVLTQADGSTAGVDYGEVRPRIVAEDILRDAHPVDASGAPVLTVSERGDPAALAALDALPHLPRWSRSAGTGARALARLVERISLLTGKPYGWRLKRDGSVWIGVETWPAYVATVAPKDPPLYTEEPNARGLAEIALDAPDLDPGSTVQAPEDQGGKGPTPATVRVSSVRYAVDEEGAFRARATLAEPTPGPLGREQDIRRRWVEGALPPQSLRVPWFATVVSQDADGALGLRLEDGAPLLTLSAVAYWPGLPGYLVQVPMGAQCIVEFIGGREDKPVVRSWGPNTPVTLLRYTDGDAAFARAGDATDTGTMTGAVTGSVVTFTITPPGGGTPTTSPTARLLGKVTSGSPYFVG